MSLKNKTGAELLTPVQNIGGMFFKRDDLFQPFGKGSVNGGKLRQAILLIDGIDAPGVITGASIHSPQTPIVAAAAHAAGKECICVYGGTNWTTVSQAPMSRLAASFQSDFEIAASGRHSVLNAKANELAEKTGYTVIKYGFQGGDESFFESNARQVSNLPNVRDLVMVCGSGITATGVIHGIGKFRKPIERIHLVGTAPNRSEKVHTKLKELGSEFKGEILFHDLYPKIPYEKRVENVKAGDVHFHPHYEAKAMMWMKHRSKRYRIDAKNCVFWIVGSEPKLK